jgi:hypothetical protein
MTVLSFEGVVENGIIQLPLGILLPDKTIVYVIVPDSKLPDVSHVRSPRLADPKQANHFKLEVTDEECAHD